MRRRKMTGSPGPCGWGVTVGPALKQSYEMTYRASAVPTVIPGQIAVRRAYNGREQTTYGVVSIVDSDFEDKIMTMRAGALEKAAALNAVGATG